MKSSKHDVSLLVDVIIPVHNASTTIQEAVRSSMSQTIPEHLTAQLEPYSLSVSVCCYDDGSTDASWSILQTLQDEFADMSQEKKKCILSKLFIERSSDGIARGAGFSRNKAVALQTKSTENERHHFLCLLDSDDIMHPHRVAEQLSFMLALAQEKREKTLLGCNFDRDPPDSTWHYCQWANSIKDDRLILERFREVTVLQPTWFLCRKRLLDLGGYVEAPPAESSEADMAAFFAGESKFHNRLVHSTHDTAESLRLAEDLRLFHDHLDSDGIVSLHRTKDALVTYRHTGGSQSFRTSRRLLLQLRVLALERSVLRSHPSWKEDDCHFVVWGAGRDGKEFYKALSEDIRSRVYCFVDVDEKKLQTGRYMNQTFNTDIPIIHFSFLISDANTRLRVQADWELGKDTDAFLGRINKGKPDDVTANVDHLSKRRKSAQRAPLTAQGLDIDKLQRLPVVVCVAMHRTAGMLEKNVETIGRCEGSNLWHFC